MAEATISYEGGCSCGAVRYRVSAEPMFVHCCHCEDCQRQSGSAFVVNALVETSSVELLQGDLANRLMPTPSGAGQRVERCAECQVAVWSHFLAFGEKAGEAIRFVRVGTLDNPTQISPDIHIFTASKQPWLNLDGDAIVAEAFYSIKDTWPDASLARFAKLR